jgi:hypothetical protein
MVQNVAPDLPAPEARVLAVTQARLAGAPFGQTVTAVAWKAKPSWYAMTPEDRVVSPSLQTALAARMNAKITTLQASHMSLLSEPVKVANVIEDAVVAVTAD